ncbi:hypothetical protein [Pseudonocardia sp. ICBG1293]|nr:hypothetical protein [Pseudonocardia sp. ICBG1293]
MLEDRAELYGTAIDEGEDPEIWFAEGSWRGSGEGEDYGAAPLADLVQMVLASVRRSRRPGGVCLHWTLGGSTAGGDVHALAAARGVDLPEWA